MAYTLGNKCAKNLSKRTVLHQLIIKNVVTCFFGTQCTIMSISIGIVFLHLLPIPALALPDSRINALSHSFAVRIVPVGNSLPNDVVTAANIYLFKNRLSKTNLAYALRGK